jgi:hypothetical protein
MAISPSPTSAAWTNAGVTESALTSEHSTTDIDRHQPGWQIFDGALLEIEEHPFRLMIEAFAVQMDVAGQTLRNRHDAVNVVRAKSDTVTLSQHNPARFTDLRKPRGRTVVDPFPQDIFFVAYKSDDDRPCRVIVRWRAVPRLRAHQIHGIAVVVVLIKEIESRSHAISRRREPFLVEEVLNRVFKRRSVHQPYSLDN